MSRAVSHNKATMLVFALFWFALPSIFAGSVQEEGRKDSSLQILSLLIAIVMLSMYLMFMIFQLYTHADMYQPEAAAVMSKSSSTIAQVSRVGSAYRPQSQLVLDDSETEPSFGLHSRMVVNSNASNASTHGGRNTFNSPPTGVAVSLSLMHTTDDPVTPTTSSQPPASLNVSLCVLLITLIFGTASSQVLVSTLDGFSARIGLGPNFFAVVLLPVAANTVEHMSTVMVARHNKMDMSVGIACGS